MTNLGYYGLDDLEMLEETEKRKKKAQLRDQLIATLVVTGYGAFLVALFWAMSIKPALPV